MCSRQDKLDRFFILKAEIQTFFALKTEHNWLVNKCTRNSSFSSVKIDGLDINRLNKQNI